MSNESTIFIIYGNLPRKSNSRRVVKHHRTKKIMVIKSENALNYSKSFVLQMLQYKYDLIISPVILTATIFYQSKRSDLSEELLMDLLQECKLIKNDRQIWEKHIYKKIDKENPRVEFEVTLKNEK